MKKTIELFKEYGNVEAQAVNNFLRLSYKASNKGYKGLQQHFLSEGREDMEHSTMIVEFLKEHYDVEFEPINAMLDEKVESVKSYEDFLDYFV
jgi:ferritin